MVDMGKIFVCLSAFLMLCWPRFGIAGDILPAIRGDPYACPGTVDDLAKDMNEDELHAIMDRRDIPNAEDALGW